MANPSRISRSVTHPSDQVELSVDSSTVAWRTFSGAGSTNLETSATET